MWSRHLIAGYGLPAALPDGQLETSAKVGLLYHEYCLGLAGMRAIVQSRPKAWQPVER